MEHVLLALVVLCTIVIGFLAAKVLSLADILTDAQKELNQLRSQKGEPSVELTEFLRDQSQFGFSFVRVDPAAVSVTIPRR